MRDLYELSGNFEKAQISITTHTGEAPIDIRAATKRLTEMPIDYVPSVEHLPTGSVIPWRSNSAIQGRDADLIRIAQNCVHDPRAQQVLAITGMGGVGKTQLAAEFCHRYGTFFTGGVFWLHCGQTDAIGSQFASFGAGLGLVEGYATLPLNEQIRLTRRALASPVPRLLVLDSCEDEQMLADWRPSSGTCRVIVTSRKAQWSIGCNVAPIALEILQRKDSIALLRTSRGDLADDDAALAAIADELGDLPLALHLAACFLARYKQGSGADPAAYLNSLRSAPVLRHRSLTAGGWSPTGHEQHVAKTFAVALEQLDPTDEFGQVARYILRFASRLAVGLPIPRYMLAPSAEEMDAEPDVDLDVLARQEDALHRLADLGLLALQEDGSAIMHTLVAAFADDVIDDVIDETSVAERVERYLLDLLSFLLHLKDPRETLPLSPHLRRVAELAEARSSPLTASLYLVLGEMLYEAGDLSGSAEHFARAEQVAPTLSPEGSADGIRATEGRATSLRVKGDIEQSIDLHRHALAQLEASKPDDPGVRVMKFNLAWALQADVPDEALQLLEQLEDANKRDITETGFDSLERLKAYSLRVRVLTGLGQMLKDRDRSKARLHLRSAAVLALALQGPHSLDRWHPLSILASIDVEEDRVQAAIRRYAEAVAAITQRQGDDASLLGDPLIGLGHAYVIAGEYDQARRVLERALALTERYVGLTYPGARQATLDLAIAYIECKLFKSARALLAKEIKFLEASENTAMARTFALQTLIVACLADGDRRAAKRHRSRLLLLMKQRTKAARGAAKVEPRQAPCTLLRRS